MSRLLTIGSVRWLEPAEGGRRSGPPPGPRYAATAYVEGDAIDDGLFSIVLRMPEGAEGPNWSGGNIELLSLFDQPTADAQVLLMRGLAAGRKLHITEGARTVALFSPRVAGTMAQALPTDALSHQHRLEALQQRREALVSATREIDRLIEHVKRAG